MVTKKIVGGLLYLLGLAFIIAVVKVSSFAPYLKTHPMTVLVFLFYLGAPEFYILTKEFFTYFSAVYHQKKDVILEVKSILITYITFLVLAVISNFSLNSSLFMAFIAVILPFVSGIIGVGYLLYLHVKELQKKEKAKNVTKSSKNLRKQKKPQKNSKTKKTKRSSKKSTVSANVRSKSKGKKKK
ncbi:hypothetical protein ACFLZN_01705 [Nanoarchaeota archaeon]